MQRTIFILILILFQIINISAKSLSLDEFITLACRNDRVFHLILKDELLLQYNEALDLPPGDLILSIEAQYNLTIEEEEGSPEASISLKKLFPSIGTALTARFSSVPNKTLNENRSEFSFLISQPIAKNAFGKANRLQEEITGIENDLAKHQIIEAYEDYMAALIKTYYNWYSAYINFKTGKSFYKENLKSLAYMKKRQKNRIALQIDVNKIYLQVLEKKQNLISLSNNYTRYLNLISRAIDHRKDTPLEPVEPSLYKKSEISFQQDYEKFKKESRTYKTLNLLEEKGTAELDMYYNDLLPSIDLIMGYNLQETGIDKKIQNKVFAGIAFEFPFPGQKENAKHDISKINLERTRLSSTNKHVRLYTGLKNLYNRIENQKKIIGLADKKVKLAEDIVADETKNYSYGRIKLNDLISAKKSLEQIRFNKISQTIELYGLIIEWLQLTDKLVTKTPK